MEPQSETGTARPTAEAERIHALDAIRGVAITGVLFAETVWSLGGPDRSEWSAFDHFVAKGMDYLVDNKFLSLFACLFGIGIAQQWHRWEMIGANVRVLHVRRMGFLFLVGLIHAVLVRNGDILAPYALLGFLALALRRAPLQVLAPLAVAMFFLPCVVGWAMAGLGLKWPSVPIGVTGGFLWENLAWLKHWYLTNPLTSWPRILSLILTGIMLVRAGVVERLATDRRLARRTVGVSLGLAVVTRLALNQAAAAWPGTALSLAQSTTLSLLYQLNSFALAAAYGSLLFLACQSPGTVQSLKPVRCMGRMAFTNYLSQAFIAVPVCLVFGLFDQISPGRGFVFGLAIGAAQFAFSSAWLRRHPMGPLERLWRRATYGAASANPAARPPSIR